MARNLFKVTEGGALWFIRGQHEWSPSNYGVEPTIIINRQRFCSLLTFISTSLNIHSQLDPILAKIVYHMYRTLSHEDVYKFDRQPLFNMVIKAASPTPRRWKPSSAVKLVLRISIAFSLGHYKHHIWNLLLDRISIKNTINYRMVMIFRLLMLRNSIKGHSIIISPEY